MKQLTFPMLFGVTPPADNTAPYAATYTIVDSSNTDGSYNISTMDNVDNSFSGAPVSVRKDFINPTVSLAVEEAAGYAFNLTLASADALSGPSGIYDVEYRDGVNGAWQLWQSQTTETGLQFTAIPGHSVYFRVRSNDRVDNEGQSAVMGPYTVELETRKYYYFGGQRVAMRVVTASTNQVYYLHGDHLGSVSLTTDSSGAVVAQARYMPYGEVRWESSPSLTDFSFTGQRLDGFGLMDFNARYFSPRLGRFVSADSIVPNPGSPQAFDRYAYAYNNSLLYVDPSGHTPNMICADDYRCWSSRQGGTSPTSLVLFANEENTAWTNGEIETINSVAMAFANGYADAINQVRTSVWNRMRMAGENPGTLHLFSPAEAFLKVHQGPVTFTRANTSCNGNGGGCAGETISRNQITIYNNATAAYIASHPRLIAHELSHALNSATGKEAQNIPEYLMRPLIEAGKDDNGNTIYRIDHGNERDGYYGYAGGWDKWQFGWSSSVPGSEEFADMGVGWYANNWEDSDLGRSRESFMNGYMQRLMWLMLGSGN